MCYDCKDIQTLTMPSFLQATRLRKGNLIKVGNDLFRILELHHLTPGNKRAHIQVRMRNIRTQTLADQKFRAEEDVERATRGRCSISTTTATATTSWTRRPTSRSTSRPRRWATRRTIWSPKC